MIGDKLYKKLMFTHLIVIVATLTALGFLMTILLTNYFNYNKRSELMVKGADIADLLRPLLLDGADPTDMVAWLNRADRNLGTEVWVIRPDGTIITGSAHTWRHEGNRLEKSEILALQKGNVAVREGQSQFYSEPVVWVTTPIKAGEEVIGGVILFSPVVGINQTIERAQLLLVYGVVIALIFSAGVGYFFAKSVFAPLEKMNEIARKIAKGDFSERLEVNTQDEIGMLGRSINYMADKLEKNENTRREFLANVSHDLRTPLTSILGFVEALQDNKDKNLDSRNRFLGILHSETSRLIRLVNDLLDFTKIEDGILELDCKEIELEAVVREVLKKYKPFTEKNGIDVEMCSTGTLPKIYGDLDRLAQVFTNLFDNSLRYAHKRLIVEFFHDSQQVWVRITDDGPGIPEKDLPNIWDRFYKVDKSRSKNAGGTGLGLAIVKRLVEAHGGAVKVTSPQQGGAVFEIYLPIKSPD